ncbi:MAG: entericidin [Opitutales bacterium]
MKIPSIKTGFAVLLGVSALLFSSCNTFHGIGKDIEALGGSMQKKAEEEKD